MRPAPPRIPASRSSFAGETLSRIRAHAERCSSLPALRPGEAERLVADYAAQRGGITRCPTVFLIPLQQR